MKRTSFPKFADLLAVLGTVALICTERSWVNTRLLSSRPIVLVGLISYSWYLWHWPLMSYLRIIVPTTPSVLTSSSSNSNQFRSCWTILVVCRKAFSQRNASSTLSITTVSAALAIALVVPITIKLGGGLPQRLSEQTKRIEAVASAGRGNECLAWLESKPNLSSECVFVIKDRPAVALIGDSHAAALSSGLRELTYQQNLGFRIFTKSSCPPLLDGVSSLGNILISWTLAQLLCQSH